MATMKTSKTIGGKAHLDKPGVYHANVVKVNEQPVDRNNSPIDGFQVTFGVLIGEENGKSIDITFYNPKETDKESQQEFAMRKQTALVVATGLLNESQIGGEVEVDLAAMTNRQVIVELELSKPKPDGKQYLQLAFDRVFHIDDPRMAKIAKSADALKFLPASFRRKPESFDMEKLGGKSTAASSANGSGGSTNGNGKATAPVADSLDDLLN